METITASIEGVGQERLYSESLSTVIQDAPLIIGFYAVNEVIGNREIKYNLRIIVVSTILDRGMVMDKGGKVLGYDFVTAYYRYTATYRYVDVIL